MSILCLPCKPEGRSGGLGTIGPVRLIILNIALSVPPNWQGVMERSWPFLYTAAIVGIRAFAERSEV